MSPSTLTLASDPQIAQLTAERDRLRSSRARADIQRWAGRDPLPTDGGH
jgi:hypothetical protein